MYGKTLKVLRAWLILFLRYLGRTNIENNFDPLFLNHLIVIKFHERVKVCCFKVVLLLRNAFYFIITALFIFKIVRYLIGTVTAGKRLDKKIKVMTFVI